MLTVKLLRHLRQLWREDKSFEGGALIGMLIIAFTAFAVLTIPLLIVDLFVLFVRYILKKAHAAAVRRAEMEQQRQRDVRACQATQAAEKARALASVEAEQRDVQARLVKAENAFEPAVNELRRHWANCYDLIGDRCSLKELNDAIERIKREPSPHVILQQLASLKDSMTRDAVRIRTEQLYEQFAPFISQIVPRGEFDRLMREAQARSSIAQDYVDRLRELSDWLGTIAGPAKGRWEESHQQEKLAAYERLFADDGVKVEENPFEEPAEEQHASRVG